MLCEDVIERARQSRTATAQVCDMIETMRPDFVDSPMNAICQVAPMPKSKLINKDH